VLTLAPFLGTTVVKSTSVGAAGAAADVVADRGVDAAASVRRR